MYSLPLKRHLTGKQLGPKVKELFILVETIPNWEQYVSTNTENIVKLVYEKKNITEVLEQLSLKYVTVYKQLEHALKRIKEKKVDHLRQGCSVHAKHLFKLMESPNWEIGLTTQEVLLAKEFQEEKNFYAVGRKLNLIPGNIVATLYGNTKKIGVIKKLEKKLKQ